MPVAIAGSAVAGRRESRVDDGRVRISDRRQPGLIERALLDVGEEERAVLDDRPADAGAELRLAHRQRRSRQRVARVQASSRTKS